MISVIIENNTKLAVIQQCKDDPIQIIEDWAAKIGVDNQNMIEYAGMMIYSYAWVWLWYGYIWKWGMPDFSKRTLLVPSEWSVFQVEEAGWSCKQLKVHWQKKWRNQEVMNKTACAEDMSIFETKRWNDRCENGRSSKSSDTSSLYNSGWRLSFDTKYCAVHSNPYTPGPCFVSSFDPSTYKKLLD